MYPSPVFWGCDHNALDAFFLLFQLVCDLGVCKLFSFAGGRRSFLALLFRNVARPFSESLRGWGRFVRKNEDFGVFQTIIGGERALWRFIMENDEFSRILKYLSEIYCIFLDFLLQYKVDFFDPCHWRRTRFFLKISAV